MDDLLNCRVMELLCHQRAKVDPSIAGYGLDKLSGGEISDTARLLRGSSRVIRNSQI